MILTIRGSVPNKKDLLRRKWDGPGLKYDRQTKAAINGIVLQLRAQWKGPPLECAQVIVKLFRKSARFDPDGQKATILDALKQAGVIVDDNAARVGDQRVIPCRVYKESAEHSEVQVYAMDSQWPQRKRKRVSKGER